MYSDNKPKGISIDEIVDRLKLSRNYVTRNITHCVRHVEDNPSKGTRVLFDSEMLRKHLANKASFFRQTMRIDVNYEIQKYMKVNNLKEKPNMIKFLGNIPDMKTIKRSQIPAIRLQSIDFWDLDLIFPREYTRDYPNKETPVVPSEIFYRDMFKVGAIKIQLGNQKSMFYISGKWSLRYLLYTPVDSPDCFLVPADWEPFYKGLSNVDAPPTDKARLEVCISGYSESFDTNAIEKALRKGFKVDRIKSCVRNEGKSTAYILFEVRLETDSEEDFDDTLVDSDIVSQEHEESIEDLLKKM